MISLKLKDRRDRNGAGALLWLRDGEGNIKTILFRSIKGVISEAGGNSDATDASPLETA